MALVKCPECGRENVSSTAESCPGCGYNVKTHYIRLYNKTKLKLQQRLTKQLQIALESKKIEEEKRLKLNQKFIKEQHQKQVLDIRKHISTKKLIFLTLSIVSIILFILLVGTVKSYNIYNTALGLKNKEEYIAAIKNFSKLNNFKDSNNLITECKYKQAKVYASNGKYEDAIKILEGTIKVSFKNKKLYDDYVLKFAKWLYRKGEYEKALTYFEKANVEKIEKYIENIKVALKIQGNWCNKPNNIITITKNEINVIGTFEGIDDNNYIIKSIEKENINNETSYHITLKNNISLYYHNDTLKLIPNGGILSGNLYQLCRVEDFIYEENPEYEPTIGMTKDEVENSKWGKPRDINKTTYSWGTHEQWCYYGNKYIYFKNGVVTAIQE